MVNYEIKEISNEGLCYHFEAKVASDDILKKLDEALVEEQKTFKMAGYRDGKVPMQMVRKTLGANILSGLIEEKVDSVVKEVIESKAIKPALQPVVEIKEFNEKVGMTFTAKIEYIEDVPFVDWSQISLDVVSVDVMQEDMDKALADIIEKFKMFKDAEPKHIAKKGDAVVVDFYGKIADKDFEGNKGTDVRIELGSNQFIPGFEEQLIGAKTGSNLSVRVTFPKNYSIKSVSGKAAIFDVTVKKVLVPEGVKEINDDFAKELGLESRESLLDMVKDKISSDLNSLARLYMKKILFDKIDEVYKFEVPAGMVSLDFQSMWDDLEARKKSDPTAFKSMSDADLRAEYQEIARRRVRLGIILAELAKENNIEVTEDDVQKAIFAEAMMRPGQESMVMDFYSKDENKDRLKGPILEEKAVDYVLSKINQNEVNVTSKEFFEKYAPQMNDGNAGK